MSVALHFGELEVSVDAGSILDVTPAPSVLVSSDDNYLSHGGGVSRAIWDAAGPDLEAEASQLRYPFQLSDIVETTGGRLDAQLFHAVVIDYDRNVRIRAVEMTPLVTALLLRADQQGAESVAMPLFGTGAGRVSVELAARAISEGILAASRTELRALRRVTVATADADAAGVVETELGKLLELVPDLGVLAMAAAPQMSKRLAKATEDAVAQLATPQRSWALVTLTETALRALGGEALRALRSAFPSGAAALPADLDESLARRLVRADGKLADELPPGLSLGQFHSAVRALCKHADLPLPRHVDAAIGAAVEARNRLAHGSGDVAPALERHLALLYAHLAPKGAPPAHDGPHIIGTTASWPSGPSLLGGVVDAVWNAWQGRSEPASSAPKTKRPTTAPQEEPAGDDAHVRRFVALVRALFTESQLEELDDELTALGYVGEPDLKLLEYAVRHEDPAGWLADELPIRTLREQLKQHTGAKPGAHLDGRALAQQLMELLGFPRARRIEGLPSAIRALQSAQARIHAASATEVNGLVIDCATRVERVVLVLLRFVCKAGFGQPPELYIRERHPKLLEPGRQLDRASLGTVLTLLEHLAKDFESTEEPRAMILRRDLDGERLVPKGTTAIAQMRNQFAHLRDETAQPSLEERRQRASAFFAAALDLLAYFARPEHRVYPRVIRVIMVRIDALHRRVVEAEDEQGHPEFIFSGRPMMPGEVYYMHPLTNPFRVDPILVEAGDLASASAASEGRPG